MQVIREAWNQAPHIIGTKAAAPEESRQRGETASRPEQFRAAWLSKRLAFEPFMTLLAFEATSRPASRDMRAGSRIAQVRPPHHC